MYKHRKIPYFQTDSQELKIDDIMEIIMQHKKYANKYLRNERYYDGKHDILKREFEDKSKANNKVIVDLPAYTVDVRSGYFSGEPVTFTSSNEKQNKMINEIINYNDFQYLNNELDVMSSIYGHAFLILYMNEESKISMGVDDPYNTVVIHDSTIEHNVVGALRYFEYNDVVSNKDCIKITLYRKESIIEFNGPIELPEVINKSINPFLDIPVIEFVENSNRCGSFEKHISTVDAIEAIISSNVNEIEYFDNAYLHLKGVADDISQVEYSDFDSMKRNKILLTLADGDAKFLTKDINDTYIQNTLNRLFNNYFILTKTPNLSDEQFAGNVSGTSLKFKLFNLDKDMSRKEAGWKKSLQRMLELITNIHNLKSMNFDYRDVKLTFTRALPTNETEQVDMLTKLDGLVSHKTLLSQIDFIENPDEELKLIDNERIEYINSMNIYNNDNNNGVD